MDRRLKGSLNMDKRSSCRWVLSWKFKAPRDEQEGGA